MFKNAIRHIIGNFTALRLINRVGQKKRIPVATWKNFSQRHFLGVNFRLIINHLSNRPTGKLRYEMVREVGVVKLIMQAMSKRN